MISLNREPGRASTMKLLLAILSLMPGISGSLAQTRSRELPLDAAQLYSLTNVWTVHLKFTEEQWEAMEPKGGPTGGFGGPGPGGPRGPGGPGGFGPGMFVAPAFLSQGDENQDGKLSRKEFMDLGEKWFVAWDKEKRGKLNSDEIREGLNLTLGGTGGLPAPSKLSSPGGLRSFPPPGPNLQGPEGKRNGIAAAMGIEYQYVHADLEFEGETFKNVAVRYKGNGTFLESRGGLKRPLKVDLNKYVKVQRLAGVTKLNLHNNVTDASWMNEVLSYQLYRDADVPAPRSDYAKIYVTVPGKFERKYFGLYSLVEDVDKRFTAQHFATKKGALFKPVTSSLFADLGSDWSKYKQTYDPKDDTTLEEAQRVMALCRLVTEADDAEFAGKLGDYIELDEFARFMAVMVYLSDLDGILGPGQNFYLFLAPKTQKFTFIPWDQDHSFGQFAMRGTQEQRENLSIWKPWQGENRFLERAFKVDAFRKLYSANLEKFSRTIFKAERFAQQVDTIAAAIRPAVKEESEEKLGRFDKVIAGESISGGGFGRFGGSETKPIKPFVKIRAQSVEEQVAGKSEGEMIEGFGFGGRRPGGGRGGPGGPGGFGPGMFLSGGFMSAMDVNKDSTVSHQEFIAGFNKWFEAWDTGKAGLLTEEQLREGINRELGPGRGGISGPPGFRPPGDAPGGDREN